MPATFNALTLSVTINCPPREVYDFVSNPQNLPLWATAFCLSARQTDAGWLIETTVGPMSIRFADSNELGVLDHVVSPALGVEIHVPMRVIPNGSGSEVLFTLFQLPDMTKAKFEEDRQWVQRDLQTLKSVLEFERTN